MATTRCAGRFDHRDGICHDALAVGSVEVISTSVTTTTQTLDESSGIPSDHVPLPQTCLGWIVRVKVKASLVMQHAALAETKYKSTKF